MPLVSAVVIHYTTPIFTIVIAALMWRKALSKLQWLYLLTCFAGIVVLKGFDFRIDKTTLLAGLLGTLAAALAYNIISKLKESEHYLVIMFYFPLVTLPLVTLYIWFTGEWADAAKLEWLMLTAVGVLTYAAQYFLTRAYQLGDVAQVSVTSYLGVIYAIVFGLTLFGEYITFENAIGIGLILGGVIGTVWLRRTKD